MPNSNGPTPKQIRNNRIYLLAILLIFIVMPVPIVRNIPVPLIVGLTGAGIGALCIFGKSNWRFLLIPLWWICATYTIRQLSLYPPFSNIDDFAALSILIPPVIGYNVARGIIIFERTNLPQSAYYVQWSDGIHNKDHIDNPTAEQILAEFDKLDGSARSTLRVQLGLPRVDICLINDDMTVLYYTDDHELRHPWYAVYPPGYTQEGVYFGPFGGAEGAIVQLYVFISRVDNRRALEEFLATGDRPDSLLWEMSGTLESGLNRPWWN